MNEPLVSVLLPSFGYARYLPQAIESVLAQTYANWELLVADNKSTDGSLEIARDYAARDPRVRVIEQPENIGLFPNLLSALAAGRGEFIAMVSADDAFLPGHIENAVGFYARHPDIDLYYTSYVSMDVTGKPVGKPFQPGYHGAYAYARRDEFAQLLLWDSFMSIQAMLIRRSIIDRYGYLDPIFKVGADYDMFLRYAKAGLTFAFEDRPSVMMRFHPDNTSGIQKFVVGGLQLREYLSFWERHLDPPALPRIAGRAPRLNALLDEKIGGVLRFDPENAEAIIAAEAPRIAAMRERFATIPETAIDLPAPLPRVSVILPTVGNVAFLTDALASLAAQTYDRFEVVVVGDGAPDLELLLATVEGRERIRFVRSPGRTSPAHARNVGLRAARGDVIAYLDEDNVVAPAHLAAAMEVLDRHPHLHTVVMGAVATIEHVEKGWINPRRLLARDGTTYALEGRSWADPVANRTPLNAIVHRRSIVDLFGEFNPTLPVLEDWDFILRLGRGNTGVMDTTITVDVRFRTALIFSHLGERWPAYRATAQQIQAQAGAEPHAAAAALDRIDRAMDAVVATPDDAQVLLALSRALRGD